MQEAIKTYLKNKPFDRIHLKTVLFDMDGVIFDSMKYHATSWSETMADLGIYFSTEEAYLHEGRTGKSTINIVFERELGKKATEEEIKTIYQTKTRKFNEHAKVEVMPGITGLLEKVKANGLQPMVVTGSGQKSLLEKLATYFPGIFLPEYIITAGDVTRGKPDPEPYLKALSKGNFQPEEAIVIENAPLGVEAAHRAGLFTIGVNTGPLPDSVLKESGADFIFRDVISLNEKWDEVFLILQNTTQ